MDHPKPAPSADVLAAAAAAGIEPPTEEDIAGTQGSEVVLPPDSAASMGARGVYPTELQNRLLRDAGYVQMGLDPHDPDGSLTDPDVAAPVNVDVPHVSQAGDTLTCTMGNWQGEPTSYAYAWAMDGTAVGTDAATHTVAAGDVGKTATCTVTAMNSGGATVAPPSVGVVVADPAAAMRSSSRHDNDKRGRGK